MFDPTFDEAYVKDMEQMTDYLVSTGRIKSAKSVLDYTYSDPLGAVDPGWSRWQGDSSPRRG